MPISAPLYGEQGPKSLAKFVGYIVISVVISLTPLCYIAHPLIYNVFYHLAKSAHLFSHLKVWKQGASPQMFSHLYSEYQLTQIYTSVRQRTMLPCNTSPLISFLFDILFFIL